MKYMRLCLHLECSSCQKSQQKMPHALEQTYKIELNIREVVSTFEKFCQGFLHD
jgi:hypothetical protein